MSAGQRQDDDWRWIGPALSEALSLQKLSTREAGFLIGIGHATVARIMKGEAPDIDTYFRVRNWLRSLPVSHVAEHWKVSQETWDAMREIDTFQVASAVRLNGRTTPLPRFSTEDIALARRSGLDEWRRSERREDLGPIGRVDAALMRYQMSLDAAAIAHAFGARAALSAEMEEKNG